MSIRDHIEAAVNPDLARGQSPSEQEVLASIAISLKRIADRLDGLSEPAAIYHACQILARALQSYGIGR